LYILKIRFAKITEETEKENRIEWKLAAESRFMKKIKKLWFLLK